jgi:hypothetical protein
MTALDTLPDCPHQARLDRVLTPIKARPEGRPPQKPKPLHLAYKWDAFYQDYMGIDRFGHFAGLITILDRAL